MRTNHMGKEYLDRFERELLKNQPKIKKRSTEKMMIIVRGGKDVAFLPGEINLLNKGLKEKYLRANIP